MKCSELLRLLKKAGWVEVSLKGLEMKIKKIAGL
jgi:predicted RNA binding protein YcfA (HicA-like mRNA interferase family)